MPVKRITHPETGQVVYLGRNRPPVGRPRLRIRDYIKLSVLPTPPATFDYSPAAMASLSRIYFNDRLGDCVIAWLAHLIGVLTGNGTGNPFLFTDDQIVALYSAIGGYVPGNPSTDNGCDEWTALEYLKTTGAPAGQNQDVAAVSVDGSNPSEYLAALWLLENLMYGVELPDAWISPFPSAPGFVWDVAGDADPQNGHCFGAVGATPAGLKISTWGMLGMITPAATAKYATTAGSGELYAVLSQEVLQRATDKSPSGVDWEHLVADVNAMGGNLVLPA